MIVGEDDGRAPMNCRVADDRAQREFGAGFVTWMIGQAAALALCIEVRNPKVLQRRVALRDTAAEEGARGCDAIELERRFGTLITHTRS